MRYYYLQADNTPGGPESLESLVAMVAAGRISLATLVVPVGGEDWMPLARVLSFHYADAQGQPAGPVPFSELSRMQQVQALTVESWVLPVGAVQWVSLKDVLTSGGAAIAETVVPSRPVQGGTTQPVRGATSAVRTPGARGAAGGENPYAAPKTQVRKVIVQHASGGLNRLQYFLASIGLSIAVLGLLAVVSWSLFKGMMDLGMKKPGQFSEGEARALMEGTGMKTVLLMCGVGLLALVVSIWIMVKRNRNIGWPGVYVLFSFVPLVNIWYGFALMAYPPGYARHRRFDTVTKVLLGLMVMVIAVYIVLFAFAMKKARELEMKAKAPPSLDEVQRSVEEAAKNQPATTP